MTPTQRVWIWSSATAPLTSFLEDVTVSEDGTFVVEDVDVSTLADGELTVTATYTDADNNTATATDVVQKDTTYGEDDNGDNVIVQPTVSITDNSGDVDGNDVELISGTEQATIRGTIGDTDAARVDLVISDGTTDIVLEDVTVSEDGSFVVEDVNVSALADGELTVTATYTDADNNVATAEDTVQKDTTFATSGSAANDDDVTKEDTAITVDVLANDSDSTYSGEMTLVAGSVSLAQGFENAGTVAIVNNQIVFTPAHNFSGEDIVVNYTAMDAEGNTANATLTLDVTPVADAPKFEDSAVNSNPGDGLTIETWTGVYPEDSQGNWDGSGVSADRLEAVVRAYVSGSATADSYNSSTIQTVTGSTYSGQGTLTVISGFIYLEADTVYAFGGQADDSLYVKVGSDIDASATWGTGAQVSGDTVTVEESGYYPIEIAHHNEHANGFYQVNITANGVTSNLSTDHFSLFSDADAIEESGIRLGGTVSDEQGNLDHYIAYSVNEGDEDTSIPLTSFTVDVTDESETITEVTVDGAPVGTVLTDGTNTVTFVTEGQVISVKDFDFENMSLTPPQDFNGTINLTFTATSTEGETCCT
ncbi:cadherin-like domain-containing protein [Vibrio sp. CDRSL-10 TSBA]